KSAEWPEANEFRFTGNQFRIYGDVGPDGGWADVYVDGAKQLTKLEFWNPEARVDQPVYSKSGLANGEHEVKVVPLNAGNPLSKGTRVRIRSIQHSAAVGESGYGSGGGPKGPQRMIFGYTGREDFVDSRGNRWKPATEWVVRTGFATDTIEKAWWTKRRSMYIGNAEDEELYRYGAHGKEFWVNLTVAPGTYDLRLKFADTALTPWMEREENWQRVLRSVQVWINDAEAIPPTKISEAAGGLYKAYDREFKGIQPRNGMIQVRFKGVGRDEAVIQALELVPAG
ncbi:MAG TPA: hypothetical protein VGE01_11890, partial [Fimbriimonas sp.]